MFATRRGLDLRTETYAEKARKRDKASVRPSIKNRMQLKQTCPAETQQKTLTGEDVDE